MILIKFFILFDTEQCEYDMNHSIIFAFLAEICGLYGNVNHLKMNRWSCYVNFVSAWMANWYLVSMSKNNKEC